jgi:hypothetical protein
MVEKIVEINESLKCNLHYPGGDQPKYKCPCCEKLWGRKVKFNWHLLITTCLGVKDIANHKLWPLDKIVVKETLQIINAFGGDK